MFTTDLSFITYFLSSAAIFGAIVGSFLNVVVLRMRTGRGLGGRSACMACMKTLSGKELVPVLSYVLQRGKCASCKSAISIQYVLIEATTALAFALIAWKIFFGAGDVDFEALLLFFAFSIITASFFIAIVAYDIKHMMIPDIFVLALYVLAIVRLVFLWQIGTPLFAQVLSALLIAIFFLALWALSGGRWLGFGDVKLILPLALLLPWDDNLVAVVLAFWSGAIVGVCLVLAGRFRFTKRYKMKSEIPFAPFLILGTAIAYFVDIPLFPF
ncbi:MAG: hypothetical protein COV07_03345 [Candidatus Vogelbacteria bacterium CG10_big_fil_rev_8_21_14_0_10_45_14]|uniref:Prepilin peptidase n=1 Tax=Candidatus Vogelbacteria bacterium CG10_big_fil_rev_8_21_14_0_10_45_14 TaxID=1975042 RepID=A0A2H0RJF4_9BACT|nr:MAG: hypothetical protein COV07_03345 [Candidatus Vogelbacteria bacterium CG10_big_fil_rev_8_21_14_0_10_45_14]